MTNDFLILGPLTATYFEELIQKLITKMKLRWRVAVQENDESIGPFVILEWEDTNTNEITTMKMTLLQMNDFRYALAKSQQRMALVSQHAIWQMM